MVDNSVLFVRRNRPLIFKLLLCGIWLLGLFCGFGFSAQVSDISASLMLSAADSRLSIVGLFFSLTFPFFVSAALLRYASPLTTLPLVFAKAFSFSLCACATSIAFGDAGWLVRWLLAFSDSFAIAFLLWFWLRGISGNRGTLKADLLLCIAACALLVFIDFCFVSPFLVMLINH